MNPNTNHLVDTSHLSEAEIQTLKDAGYIPIPQELDHAAKIKLRDKREAKVSFHSKGKLSNWANKIRQNQAMGKIKHNRFQRGFR